MVWFKLQHFYITQRLDTAVWPFLFVQRIATCIILHVSCMKLHHNLSLHSFLDLLARICISFRVEVRKLRSLPWWAPLLLGFQTLQWQLPLWVGAMRVNLSPSLWGMSRTSCPSLAFWWSFMNSPIEASLFLCLDRAQTCKNTHILTGLFYPFYWK